ncbi:MAG: alpha-amylase family glycosyl hydrolase, partial [Lentisphaeria bacterium]
MYYFKNNALKLFRDRLLQLYGDQGDRCLERLNVLLSRYDKPLNVPRHGKKKWSEEDVFLITYGDMVTRRDEAPLATLRKFALENLKGAVNTIHILPFSPYSSDDGFSVIDYRQVNSELGAWSDIDDLAADFRLMADLVLNHVSKQSSWYKDYVSGVMPYTNYFIEVEPDTDLQDVVRPRNSPLLRRTNTRDGVRYLWTTFSEDQIDLDFGNADVLFEFLDILLLYIEHGARVIRLDAIAYLWKRLGTGCIHLPETHEVVKLMRQVLDALAPGSILITETNVPHKENISYFGKGDEAHMVYQFSLPPLLLHALRHGNADHLSQWAATAFDAPKGCTFLNFTASHDGIGVRPLEGIIADSEINDLGKMVRDKDGYVSTKTNADGTESPYELNITYYDALAEANDSDDINIARYLCSQILPLSLKGI